MVSFFFLPTLVLVAVQGVFSNQLALAMAVPVGSGWLPSLFNNGLQGSRSYDEKIGRGEAIQMASPLVLNLLSAWRHAAPLCLCSQCNSQRPQTSLPDHHSLCAVDKQPLNYIQG